MPKDGPSAGVTMATAIASLVRDEPVADDVGMTGEITLTGQVLPIGGLREKSLAAQRAGLKRVIFPRENEPDLDELPPETRAALEFIPADTIEDVFAAAFDGKPHARAPRTDASGRAPQAAKLSRAKLVMQLTARRRRRADAATAEQLVLPSCRAARMCTRRRVAVRRRRTSATRAAGDATVAPATIWPPSLPRDPVDHARRAPARRGRTARAVGLEQRERAHLDELGVARVATDLAAAVRPVQPAGATNAESGALHALADRSARSTRRSLRGSRSTRPDGNCLGRRRRVSGAR